jgi:protein arginine kinase
MSEKEKSASSNPKDKNNPLEEIYKESMEEEQLQQERRVEIASKWMEGSGPDADIVISSRIRLARNVRKLPFPPLASDEQREKVFMLAEKVMENQGDANMRLQLLSISSLPQIFRQVLVEKHLISPLLAKESRFSALMLRDDEVISIMVNEEDHFRIQCLLPGLQLEKAWQEASRYDDFLESQVDYAFHEEKGYLTACPTNVGTGLRASVMLHLPALVITQQINRILAAVNQVGLAVRGLYGEGTEITGNLLQISNQITLGQSEEEIWHNLYSVTRQLINQEKNAREHLLNEGREKLADRAGRAFGLLKYSRMIDSNEAMQLISDVRLGVDLGLITNVPVKVLNELLVLTRPGCLQYLKGRTLTAYERDLERAVQIQKYLP